MSISGISAEEKAEIKRVETEFKNTWEIILDDIRNEPKFKDIGSSIDWLVDIMKKNVPFGKQTRAYLGIFFYRTLKPVRTEEDDLLNYVAGWMIEILQAAALIGDDIMDHSETRRGMPCWYKNSGVGITAVNDAFLMGHIVNFIAFKYFAHKDYFLKLTEFSYYNNFYTSLGESLDLAVANVGTPNFTRFTESTYKALVKYKTSYYTFHGPVVNAIICAGIQEDCIDAVEEITLRIGELFQIQDDFLDCYGNPEVTGKVGTDIRDGKLTWLIVQSLKLASESQMTTLRTHYGQSNGTAEYEVKAIYDDLGIEELFYKHEDAARVEIFEKVKTLPSCIPQEPFLNLLDTLYRREK